MALNETINSTASLADSVAIRTVELLPILNTVNPWVFFAVIVAAAVILSQIMGWILRVIVHGLTRKTETDLDDQILAQVQQPVAWIIFSLLIYVAVVPLPISGATKVFVEGFLLAFNIFVIAWLVHRFVTSIFLVWERFAENTDSVLDDTMLPILSKFAKAAVWIFAFITLLAAWGIEIGPFLAGLGIAGIALGFAVKDSLANIFGGISLALDHAYKVGDKIKLADGTVGVVHDITLRSTRIRTYDGDLVMVPNGKIANDNVYTYAQPGPKSRGQVNFGVEYGSDVEKVKKIVIAAVNKIDKVAKDPEAGVHFVSMGDFALNFRAYFWLEDYQDVWSTEREVTTAIYNALRKAKIGIPFPTHTVYTKKG